MRPSFHFTARTGWINDPHGITHRDGGYDVFFQYVPDSTVWAPGCSWGHARGTDLFSLEELPVALAPGDGDDGVWTGSLVVDPQRGTRILYTAVSTPGLGIGRVRTATPVDEQWLAWRKGAVVVEAPPELELDAFRDPFVFPDGDSWRMLVGGALADGTAVAFSYASPDLDRWRYEGIAAARSSSERAQVWTGGLWECPQLIEGEGRDVLLTSVWDADVLHYAAYGMGAFREGRFTADRWTRLTYGESYYAPSFFRDAEGRPCLLFWLRGVADLAAGWAGAHSIPYLLSWQGERLVPVPHPDLERYREQVPTGSDLGSAADLVWSRAGAGGVLSVTSGGGPFLTVELTSGELRLVTGAGTWSMPFEGGDIRIVLDGPVVEVSTSTGLVGGPVAAPDRGVFVQTSEGELTTWSLRR